MNEKREGQVELEVRDDDLADSLTAVAHEALSAVLDYSDREFFSRTAAAAASELRRLRHELQEVTEHRDELADRLQPRDVDLERLHMISTLWQDESIEARHHIRELDALIRELTQTREAVVDARLMARALQACAALLRETHREAAQVIDQAMEGSHALASDEGEVLYEWEPLDLSDMVDRLDQTVRDLGLTEAPVNLVDKFAAEGQPYAELDDDGNVVVRGDDDEGGP